MGANIQRNVLWSDSLTKEYLTTYAEGLACVNFDNRLHYDVRRSDEHLWYVLRKFTHAPSRQVYKSDHSTSIRFDRVRHVCIDREGYMSCTCGYVQRNLMPCVHICAVLGRKEYYLPSMFHVRWFKSFNYYYCQKFATDIAPATSVAVAKLLDTTRASQYHDATGMYKGVDMTNNPFVTNLEVFNKMQASDASNDPVLSYMRHIIEYTITQGPVIAGTYNVLNGNSDASDEDSSVVNDEELNPESDTIHSHINTVEGIVCLSQVEVTLSQTRRDVNDSPIPKQNAVMGFAYRDALPSFQEWFNSCKSVNQYNRLRQIISDEHFNNIAENTKNNAKDEMTGNLFGSNPTTQKQVKRKKFKHEKY